MRIERPCKTPSRSNCRQIVPEFSRCVNNRKPFAARRTRLTVIACARAMGGLLHANRLITIVYCSRVPFSSRVPNSLSVSRHAVAANTSVAIGRKNGDVYANDEYAHDGRFRASRACPGSAVVRVTFGAFTFIPPIRCRSTEENNDVSPPPFQSNNFCLKRLAIYSIYRFIGRSRHNRDPVVGHSTF